MFKKAIYYAAAILMLSSPALVSAQDFFFSFDEFSRVSTTSIGENSSGQAFIFADENIDFNQIDLDFLIDNSASTAFTGATTTNTDGQFTTLTTEDPANTGTTPPTPITSTEGRLFGVGISIPGIIELEGINQSNAPTDSDFRAGANGFLLATVDFDTLAAGTTNFDLVVSSLGVENDAFNVEPGDTAGQLVVDLTGASAVLTVTDGGVVVEDAGPVDGGADGADVPEPSSAILLILGAAGMASRRRRS